jgi:hypothetical protein
MKKASEVAVAPQTKGEIHEGCGGPIFRGGGGRKCLKCGDLLGGQQNGVCNIPKQAAKVEMVQGWPAQYVGGGSAATTARGAVAVSNGRIA